jgi:hypothetical protein
MVDMSKLDTKLEEYFKLSFILTKLVNFNTTLGGYFRLCFIMAKVGNLDANLGGYFELFSSRQMWVIYIQICIGG